MKPYGTGTLCTCNSTGTVQHILDGNAYSGRCTVNINTQKILPDTTAAECFSEKTFLKFFYCIKIWNNFGFHLNFGVHVCILSYFEYRYAQNVICKNCSFGTAAASF